MSPSKSFFQRYCATRVYLSNITEFDQTRIVRLKVSEYPALMTGKVINLRARKKAAERAEKRARADENAATFGRSKAQRIEEKAEVAKLGTHLDKHKRDT